MQILFFCRGQKQRSMYDILNRYLFRQKAIRVPGLGSLVVEHIPAVADFANKQLLPVQSKLRFDKYADAPEPAFFQYLASVQQIPDYEAMGRYNQFAAALVEKIRTEESVEWKGVGVFRKDFGGEVVFQPFNAPFTLFAPVKAERIIRADAKHSIRVGDKEKTNYEMSALLSENAGVEKESWWIYALILAAIGLSILFFHLYSHGSGWGFSGTQKNF